MKTFKTFVDESLVREQEKLEENYRTLAQKGIGAERKEDIKVGHGVDYYHPKTGDKHMGKIHSMSDKGYTVKDDKTGEKHSFDYFRKEEVELEGAELDEADFSKTQTKMAHAIGKHFKKKGIGDESKGGPYAVASAMVRDKPEAAKKAYATIKAKMKNEDHQDMLMALYDELSEENQEAFEVMLDSNPDKLLAFAQSHFAGE